MNRVVLPVDAVLPEVLARLREAGSVVLRAPTGAGKTTRVPPSLLAAVPGLIVLLEPRRVAARAAARRMAQEADEPLGETFGYHVRFDRKAGPRTRVLVVTPGVLLRMLQDDPFLESVSAVLFDEFHERGLEADLALGLLRLIRQTVRPELWLVVMSATLDATPISEYLGRCPIVTSEGRSFPVEIQYRPKRPEISWTDASASAVRDAIYTHNGGDVLVFLPGVGEIRRTTEALADLERTHAILPLHGELPPEQQDRALQKLDRRKVVLATNVAETSVTVDGVTIVIDTGQARQLEFDTSVGLDRLRLVPIAKSSADQRAGRAGRTQPGICVRLWDEIGHKSRPEQAEPEIRRVDLASAVLQLLAMGEDPLAFPWLDSPRTERLHQAIEFLRRLDALHDTPPTSLTPLGQQLAKLPIHPRLGRMLIEGQRLGVLDRAAVAAAILSDRDPVQRTFDGPPHLAPAVDATSSDLLDRVEMLEAFADRGRVEFPQFRLSRNAARFTLDASRQLERLLGRSSTAANSERDDAVLQCVWVAFSDRLAKRRERTDRRAVMIGGRGVKLGPQSGVNSEDLFVCVDIDAGGADSLVRMASAVRREWLPTDRVETRHEIEYDPRTDRLLARKRTHYLDLVIDETDGHIANEDEAAQVLADAASVHFARVLPDVDSDAAQFRTRVQCLRQWMPELELPSLDDAALRSVLPEVCRQRRSLAEVRSGPWLDTLRGLFSYQQLQTIEREVPAAILVPSGSAIRVQYEMGRPPILAARIQELFGLAETPRLAGGRVKVLLHMLAPNYRPQQVTDDLASFWANGYAIVRKELRGRYPKHDWPEDPTTAVASRGPKRRT